MLRVLLVGWAKIASGNVVAGLLRFVGIAIAARALSLDIFGLLVQIEAYTRVVDGLLNFQSVNVLTRHLAETEHTGDRQRFVGFIKAGFLVDFGTALITCLLAVSLLPILHDWLALPRDWLPWAMLFCLVIISRILGTAEAILRCFDRYGAIAMREFLTAVLLVSASLIAWMGGASGEVFLSIWLVSEVIANLVFVGWSLHVLRKNNISNVFSASARDAIHSAPDFWSQLWHTNITSGIRILSQHGDLVIVGTILGPAAAALLRAAKVTAALLSQVGRPLQQVASAQIARLWSDGNGRGLIAYTAKICLASASGGLLAAASLLAIGDIPLALAFGTEYAEAKVIVAILALATSFYLGGVTLLPTMVTLGLSERFFLAAVVGTVGFMMVLGFGMQQFGNIAVGCAHVAFNILWMSYGWYHVAKHVCAHDQRSKRVLDGSS